jgi:hypothetical protein
LALGVVVWYLTLMPYLVAGSLAFASRESGIYWLVPGMLRSFVKALMDAWVLLVEINR